PKFEISLIFNLELIKLIFQMRHHLFFKTEIKLNPELLLDLFDQYELLMLDPNSTADVFLRYEEDMHAHIKMKCDIVFGLNLYYMLHKEDLLDSFKDELFSENNQVAYETKMSKLNNFKIFRLSASQWARLKALRKILKRAFFGKDSQVLPEDQFIDLLIQYKSLSFITPLFRIIIIDHDIDKRPCFIKFNEVISELRYTNIKNDQIFLSYSQDNNSYNSIDFLNIFNEGNGSFKNSASFEVFVTEERIEGLNAMISAIIHFLPSIKTLSVSTTSKSKYNLVYEDNYTCFDMFIESLVSKNHDSLKHLNGFEMHGFNRLSLRTLLHLKQYNLEKLGVRGLFSCVDKLYLYILLREETGETLKKLYEIYRIKNTLNIVKESEFTKYNNLRNSVTHLTCTEDVLRNTMKYCIVENIQSASVHLHNYNSSYGLYQEEKKIIKELNLYKKNCVNLKETPMPLQKLEVFAEQDYMESFCIKSKKFYPEIYKSVLLMRMEIYQENNLYDKIIENQRCIYSVSELVVPNTFFYERPVDLMPAIRRLVNFRTSYEVSVTCDEMKGPEILINGFDRLIMEEKTLILRYSTNPFVDSSTLHSLEHIDSNLLEGIYLIYQKYFRISETAKLKIVFCSRRLKNSETEKIRKQVLEYIIVTQRRKNLVPCVMSALNKKIHFEREGKLSDENDD
ncbi:hypothetical protein ENBRE01_1278, partial [Enteropsectra breve]